MSRARLSVVVSALLLAAATGVAKTFKNPSGAGLPDKTIPEGTCPTGPGGG